MVAQRQHERVDAPLGCDDLCFRACVREGVPFAIFWQEHVHVCKQLYYPLILPLVAVPVRVNFRLTNKLSTDCGLFMHDLPRRQRGLMNRASIYISIYPQSAVVPFATKPFFGDGRCLWRWVKR